MPDTPFGREPIAGVILAGGQGRRMGRVDKALVDLDGRTLLAHVVERFGPQVAPLLLSSNGDPARFAAFGLEVVADPFDEPLGPLAGVAAAGLALARTHPEIRFLATTAVDTPRLPLDLVARLAAALAARPDAGCAFAVSRGRDHPVAALHRLDDIDQLMRGLADGSIRRVMRYLDARNGVRVAFPDVDGRDPFINLNRLEDLADLSASRA
ncbi:MAG: molybdenum cofactor guanylyltransferase [Hyphomicrobiales bacterium]|nr:molybdenum cofactor guanylyltransferase [Hyphomicrobiales bacterium]